MSWYSAPLSLCSLLTSSRSTSSVRFRAARSSPASSRRCRRHSAALRRSLARVRTLAGANPTSLRRSRRAFLSANISSSLSCRLGSTPGVRSGVVRG